jgi:hypothetical protein
MQYLLWMYALEKITHFLPLAQLNSRIVEVFELPRQLALQ